ncbi:hypothetical protein ACWFRB_01775 [Rhodococcus sp. NPDC055112]
MSPTGTLNTAKLLGSNFSDTVNIGKLAGSSLGDTVKIGKLAGSSLGDTVKIGKLAGSSLGDTVKIGKISGLGIPPEGLGVGKIAELAGLGEVTRIPGFTGINAGADLAKLAGAASAMGGVSEGAADRLAKAARSALNGEDDVDGVPGDDEGLGVEN